MDGEKKGSLIVVGSGIQAIRHFTWETLIVIEKADKVLYLVADPISESWRPQLLFNSRISCGRLVMCCTSFGSHTLNSRDSS